MSLINDALKRAKEAQQQNPQPAPNLQFRPAEVTPKKKSALPIILALGALLAVVGVAAFHGGRQVSLRGSTPLAATVANVNPVPPPVETPPRPAVIASMPPPTPAAQATAHDSFAPNANTPASILPTNVQPPPSANNAVIANEPAPAKPPLPKLQGILFRPDRPAAVIDGKTLFVGDRLAEAEVIAISRQSVTVTDGGQTYTLSLRR